MKTKLRKAYPDVQFKFDHHNVENASVFIILLTPGGGGGI